MPTPWYLRWDESSACQKRLKIFGRFFAEMPMPVSVTENHKLLALLFGAQFHASAGRRELQRVEQQIQNDLFQLVAIGQDGAQRPDRRRFRVVSVCLPPSAARRWPGPS